MFPSPFPELERELGVSFYNVGTGTFAFLEHRRSRNVEHGNGNVGHVPVPRLLRIRCTDRIRLVVAEEA
jgi:hypothetical protein